MFKENTDMIKPSINDLLKRDDFTELHENSGNADRGNIDKSGHCYHVITRAWGRQLRIPFSPAQSSTLAIEAARPVQMVATRGRMYCIVS